MPLTPAELTHRRAVSADARALKALTRAAYADWVPILGREPLPMRADYEAALTRHRFDLLCKGEQICALIETELRADSLWIENIAVAPSLHGQGVGRWLLDFSVNLAKDAGRERLTLYTNAKMARNIAIYQHYGFQIDREEFAEVGTIVHMSLEV